MCSPVASHVLPMVAGHVVQETSLIAFENVPTVVGHVVPATPTTIVRYIANEFTGEYLGASKHYYYDDDSSVFLTDWASQSDKAPKFLWSIVAANGKTSDCVIVNVATGKYLRDTEDACNGVGDHAVVTSADGSGVQCHWRAQHEGSGSYTLLNIGTGYVLGASKKTFNSRWDHHVLCSPEATPDPSFSKWRWTLIEPQ